MSNTKLSNTNLGPLLVALALTSLTIGGCAAQGATHPDDSVGENTDALHLSSEHSTYFTLRQDFRKCAYPMCGGAWVSRVNHRQTVCADGTRADECYVADVDLGGLALDGDTESSVQSTAGVLFRGSIESNVVRDLDFGRFAATEAWLPATSAEPTGRFWRIEDNGIRCFTTPCYSLDGHKLNRRRSGRFSGMDLSAIEASDDQLSAAYVALGTDDGLMIAGRNRWRWNRNSGWSRSFTASQFYTRAVAIENTCVISGCSSQICGDEARITTCEWNDEYACYREATCERQDDGACGWTQTAELTECIDDARVEICGTRGALPCAADEFCDFPAASICGRADGPGTCQPLPDLCAAEYAPVCGCDRMTYDNDCSANAAGTSVEFEGACCTAGPHEASQAEVEGRWNGPGEWLIEWNFHADGTFTKYDLVSPCPEGAVCFWSGIVTHEGTWALSGTDITLTYDRIDTSFGVTHPTRIAVSTNCEHLVLHDGERYYER